MKPVEISVKDLVAYFESSSFSVAVRRFAKDVHDVVWKRLRGDGMVEGDSWAAYPRYSDGHIRYRNYVMEGLRDCDRKLDEAQALRALDGCEREPKEAKYFYSLRRKNSRITPQEARERYDKRRMHRLD